MMHFDSNEWFIENADGAAIGMQLKSKLHEEQTKFQTIAIYDTVKFGHLMTIDGFVMLTQLDNFLYHEMMSHPVLFTHPNPKRVVIIGGGDCGTLQAVLQHPTVETVTQVDIDERVTRLSEQYFPELCTNNNDPRATLLFDDGIAYMKACAADSVDVVIVDSTDPLGPAEGLFSAAFYKDCLHALGDEGILVHQSESPLFHLELIRSMRGAMREAGFTQTHTLPFPQPVYPSGWWSATMASKRSAPLTKFRQKDAEQKSFDTRYYNAEIHQAALAQPELLKTL